MSDDNQIGQRLREIRSWRGLRIRTVAELSGLSFSYLAKIERGEKPVNSRKTLEALARSLQVSPVELTGKPYVPTDPIANEAHAGVPAIEDVVSGWRLGEVPEMPARPWPEIEMDLKRLNTTLRPNSDYAAQATLLPGLIRDLLVSRAQDEYRRPALRGLLDAYYAAASVGTRLGFLGLPTLAVERMCQAAEELDDPAWHGFVAWARAHVLSGTNRDRQYRLAVAAADIKDTRVEARGMANLTAALAAAAQGDEGTSQEHLAEAANLAELIDADVSPWSGNINMQFGRTNVRIWQVAIGVELGHGAKVEETAKKVRPETITASRQAGFWIDYGRGLLAERKTRDRGLAALLTAEKLAPQQLHHNAFVREAVSGLLTSARRDAGGRELRGLAFRMGVAPTG
jgi:transcriptional regulator with XRE-family HTH domain